MSELRRRLLSSFYLLIIAVLGVLDKSSFVAGQVVDDECLHCKDAVPAAKECIETCAISCLDDFGDVEDVITCCGLLAPCDELLRESNNCFDECLPDCVRDTAEVSGRCLVQNDGIGGCSRAACESAQAAKKSEAVNLIQDEIADFSIHISQEEDVQEDHEEIKGEYQGLEDAEDVVEDARAIVKDAGGIEDAVEDAEDVADEVEGIVDNADEIEDAVEDAVNFAEDLEDLGVEVEDVIEVAEELEDLGVELEDVVEVVGEVADVVDDLTRKLQDEREFFEDCDYVQDKAAELCDVGTECCSSCNNELGDMLECILNDVIRPLAEDELGYDLAVCDIGCNRRRRRLGSGSSNNKKKRNDSLRHLNGGTSTSVEYDGCRSILTVNMIFGNFERAMNDYLDCATATGGSITPKYFKLEAAGGGCVGLEGGEATNLNHLMLVSCALSDDSIMWRIDDMGMIHSKIDDSMCWQAGGGRIAPYEGQRLRIFQCNHVEKYQEFNTFDMISSGRILVADDNLCVTHSGAKANIDIDRIIIKDCDAVNRPRTIWYMK